MYIARDAYHARALAFRHFYDAEKPLSINKTSLLVAGDHSEQVLYYSVDDFKDGFSSRTCGCDLNLLSVWGWDSLPEDIRYALLACLIPNKGERLDRSDCFFTTRFERVQIEGD